MTDEELKEKVIRFDEFVESTKEYREHWNVKIDCIKKTTEGIMEKLATFPCKMEHERIDNVRANVAWLWGLVGIVLSGVAIVFIGHVFWTNHAIAMAR